jgi:tRNA pseudouridine55 synthase
MDFIKGEVIVINKDLDWTSFDVVNKIRNMLKKKYNLKKIKVGHAGTLDPKATGVVVICTGKKTKELDKLQSEHKEYLAKIKIGETTPSFDTETEVDKTYEISHINKQKIIEILKTFEGKQQQIPPAYSAVHINGQRAYQLARKGKEVNIKPREIEIFKIELLDEKLPYIKLKIKCSKGTYIRALARDIGEKLNSGAYLTELHRTASGNFTIENAITINEFENILKTKII